MIKYYEGAAYTELQAVGGGCVFIGSNMVDPPKGKPTKPDFESFKYNHASEGLAEYISRAKITYLKQLAEWKKSLNEFTPVLLKNPSAREGKQDFRAEIEKNIIMGIIKEKDRPQALAFEQDWAADPKGTLEKLKAGYYNNKPAGKPAVRKNTVRLRPGFSRTCKG